MHTNPNPDLNPYPNPNPNPNPSPNPNPNPTPDPQALATVLRSGVELVLVGQPCYPPPAWVEALFSANNPNPKP